MRTVTRYYVQFVCSNGRTRYCGEDHHMPYNRAAAELYVTSDDCLARIERIPRTHLMRHTQPVILARKVCVPDLPPMAQPRFALPGLPLHR